MGAEGYYLGTIFTVRALETNAPFAPIQVNVKTVVLRSGLLDFPDSDVKTEPESSAGGFETNAHEETFSVFQLTRTLEPS